MQRIGQPWDKRGASEGFDALVVGSGIGGLSAAALLAKHGGKRVLVLERHWTPGGFTHVFRRRGWEWDVGVHYVGGVLKPESSTRRLLDHVGDGSLEWASLGEIYDRIILADRTYDYLAGDEPFRGRMKESFPGEAKAIDRYVGAIRKVARSAGLYFAEKAVPAPVALTVGPLMRAPFLRWARRTTREVLEEITADRELIGVLTGQYGDYGLPPGRSSFAMHAILARHYLWGAGYPVTGSSAIASSIAPQIEAAGGSILYRAEVEEILVRNGRVRGVRMADGERIEAPLVVSDAGAANTFLRLLPRDAARLGGMEAKIGGLEPSSGHLCLYLGLGKSDDELGLPKHNLWIYPGHDHDASVEAFVRDPDGAPLPLVYVSFPSAKDPSFRRRFPGRSTIEVITMAPWELFARWRKTEWGSRGEEYEAMKERLAERMLEVLEGQLPGIRQHVEHVEVSTPLSTRHFAGYARGEIYGLAHTPERFAARFLRPRTPVRGLWLTGQDVASCGVAGALAAGYLSASAILGRNLLAAATRAG